MAGLKYDMDAALLKSFLDEKASQYNTRSFIETDPIQIPHRFNLTEDIEISAFLSATLAWGRKATIIGNSEKLISLMHGEPYRFLSTADEAMFDRFLPFVHRTFNGFDCIYFIGALKMLYSEHGGLGRVFQEEYLKCGDLSRAIIRFREIFFQYREPGRTAKHVPDINRGSAGKRLNMYLRWMVRRDRRGVDFGLWDQIPMSELYVPLDVHTGTVARKLGLLERKQNDWKAVIELTTRLREFDPDDPIKYDYALFGLGSFEGF